MTNNITTNKMEYHSISNIFPIYLTEPAYEKRIIYISVYESTVSNKSFKELVKSSADYVVDITKKLVKDLDGTLKNLNRNIVPKNHISTFVLPLPNELSDSVNHGWNEENGIVSSVVKGVDILDKANGVADKVLSRISDKIGARKPLIDPGYFQNYTGTTPRTFSFTFDFIPSSRAEANQLLTLIAKLKKYSTPTGNMGVLYSPHYFEISFSNEVLDNMINIQSCVISDIEVNYSGNGYMDTTVDGIPKFMKLSLTIKERRMITSDDWNSSISYLENNT
jgi:hypothetical protein